MIITPIINRIIMQERWCWSITSIIGHAAIKSGSIVPKIKLSFLLLAMHALVSSLSK